ncbi:glycosyltransferase 29 protein [Cymbomonas tetramitiformis]|uniref:Glycosyltransferase 29 protein n=1 Tax=Cymbomonas tetramitiformis TaxID=36881 RepID=A0AAE0F9W7_9CHLO|nr:glycosyltransferase 29 protein [Cymbomonas tetramitiformis]
MAAPRVSGEDGLHPAFGFMAAPRVSGEDGLHPAFGFMAAPRVSGEDGLRSADSKDAVFRINYPPIEGFEKFVGSKSTFEITNMHHVQLIADPNWRHPLVPRGTRTFRAPPGQPGMGTATLVLFESALSFSDGWRFHMVPRLLHRFPSPRTVILSPDLVVAGDEVWRHITSDTASEQDTCKAMKRRAIEEQAKLKKKIGAEAAEAVMATKFTDACKPTSGWFALVFATQICNEVHMYGFSSWKKHPERKERQARYHYFDNTTGFTNVHSFDLSLRVYKELAKHYKIVVH